MFHPPLESLFPALGCLLKSSRPGEQLSNKQRKGFPGGASGKEPTCQWRRHKRCRVDPWVGKILWRRAWQPTPVFLPGESLGQRSLAGYSPLGRKGSDMIEATYHAASGENIDSFVIICHVPPHKESDPSIIYAQN